MKDDKINNLKERLDDAIKDADSIHITIMEKLNDFEKTLKSVEISIAELPDTLTQRFDERYASKSTEVAVNRVMWIVISAVIVALLALVIKQ